MLFIGMTPPGAEQDREGRKKAPDGARVIRLDDDERNE